MASRNATTEAELPLLEDAAAVLDLRDLQDELVEVPEWSVRLRVRSLTGTERDAFEASLLESRGKSREVNLRNMRAKLVAASVRKPDDSRVFSDGRVEVLGRKNAAALQRVFRVAQRLSGLAEDEVEELTRELGEDQLGRADQHAQNCPAPAASLGWAGQSSGVELVAPPAASARAVRRWSREAPGAAAQSRSDPGSRSAVVQGHPPMRPSHGRLRAGTSARGAGSHDTVGGRPGAARAAAGTGGACAH